MFCILLAYSLPQEMEIEATDDIMRQSGSGGGESYFGTPLPRLVASRVGWLVTVFFFFFAITFISRVRRAPCHAGHLA